MRYRVGTALIAGIGAVALAAPAAAAPSTGVHTDSSRCAITNFSPRSVTVGETPITTKFGITTTGCKREGWDLEDDNAEFFVSDSGPQNTFDPSLLSDSDAGTSSVIAEATSSDFNETQRTFAHAFALRRRVEVATQTNASPEPVKKGGTVTITARLKVVDWDAYPQKYVSFGGHSVAVQFRTPTGTYKTVKIVKTNASGNVSTTATQSVTGLWRVVYGGTTVYGSAVASGDSVKVG